MAQTAHHEIWQAKEVLHFVSMESLGIFIIFNGITKDLCDR